MSWNVYHDIFGFYIWGDHMKKIIYFILIFLLLSSKKTSLKVNASQLPVPTTTALNTAQSFSYSASNMWLMGNGYEIIGNDSIYDAYNNLGGSQITGQLSNYEYKPLNTLSWQPSTNLWDANGNLIDIENAGLATASNDGQYTYFLYSTDTGEILNLGDTYETSISSLNTSMKPEMPGIINDLLAFLGPQSPANKHALALYDVYEANQDTIEYLNTLPSASWAISFDNSYGYWCTANVPGVCVQTNASASGTSMWGEPVPNFFLNGGYEEYMTIWGSGPSSPNWPNSPYPDTNTYYGDTYSLRYPVNGANVFSINGCIVHHTQYVPGKAVPSNVTYVVPNTNTNEVDDTINYDKYINQKVNRNLASNSNYNPNENLAIGNFPITVTNTYPTYITNYNYYEEYIESENTPNTGTEIGTIDGTDLTDGLPILNNLEKRFPFSIPFDVYNLLSGLSAERTTPYINTDIVIPGINYTWHFEYDLHAFDDTASLFRTLFLIFFIIGLAWLSYDHFFGS